MFLGMVILRDGSHESGHYYGISAGPHTKVADLSKLRSLTADTASCMSTKNSLKCVRDEEKRESKRVGMHPSEAFCAVSRFTLDKRWLRGGMGCSSSKEAVAVEGVAVEVNREAKRALAEQVAEAAQKAAADTEADNTLAASLQLAGLPQGMQELFKQIDVDSSGSVEWDEFLALPCLQGRATAASSSSGSS